MASHKAPAKQNNRNKQTKNFLRKKMASFWIFTISKQWCDVSPSLSSEEMPVSRTTPFFPRLSRTWTKAVFFTVSWGRESVRFWHDSLAYIHVYGNEEVTCMKSLCVSKSQFMTVDLVTERRPCEPQRETRYFLSGSERQWRLLSSFFFHNL